jgi:hypothetical protein
MVRAKLLLLWLTTIALAYTVYAHGLRTYYWYANESGRGYAVTEWRGANLDGQMSADRRRYPEGYEFRYTYSRFEEQTELRTIAIILLVASAAFLTLRMTGHASARGTGSEQIKSASAAESNSE